MPKVPNRNSRQNRTSEVDETAVLQWILERVVTVPEEWLSGASSQTKSMEPQDCQEYKTLINAWKKALKWTSGLDCSLSVMLAASASTCLVGEQLWFKIIGPPSCGKTTILEGLAINKEYVFSKDSIRGFFQGWKSEDGKDLSVAAMANRMTLATKDGDTLLKTPNLAQILGEARGLYDKVGRTHYRNAVMNDYEDHRMTWLLCGTKALREIDESELGTRFLDCVVMDAIDDEFEDEVTWRAVNQEARAMRAESNGNPDKQHPGALTEAMKMTGGYLSHLRENVVELLSRVEATPEQLRICGRFGKFVAYMRARPVKGSDDDVTREFAPRLAKQLVRLSCCLAVTLNKTTLDGEPLRRTRKIAMDTSRGKTLDLVSAIYYGEAEGRNSKSLGLETGMPYGECRRMLRFLKRIGVLRTFKQKGQSTEYWALTKMFKGLLEDVWNSK
jgi:hypothetical protein